MTANLGNPLYDRWKALGMVKEIGLSGWDIPHTGNVKNYVEIFGNAWKTREELTRMYSWAIPSPEAIAWIAARVDRLVEVGAGRGYWARVLTEAGLDVVASEPTVEGSGANADLNANHWHAANVKIGVYYPLQKADSSAAAQHPDRTLFLCWPPYDDPMAKVALDSYRGGQLLFVGEGDGGCCGGKDFWDTIEAEWEEKDTCSLPQWPGIRDYVSLFVHKSRPAPKKRRRKITLEPA